MNLKARLNRLEESRKDGGLLIIQLQPGEAERDALIRQTNGKGEQGRLTVYLANFLDPEDEH